MTARTEINYKGFQIIAALFGGKFQGRAHGEVKFVADGGDIESVVTSLKSQVDAWVADNAARLSREREERHRLFLERHGVPYQGVRSATKLRPHRVTHCYACRQHLDNAIDTECVACSWILCDCGACGCGWSGH